MRDLRANRLLKWLFLAAWLAASAGLAWAVGEAFDWRGRGLVFAAVMTVLWGYLLVSIWNDRGRLDSFSVKLAQDKESLLVSILALVLIAAVFVAYFTGWLEHVGFVPKSQP